MKTEVDEKRVAKLETQAISTIKVMDEFVITDDKQMAEASELLSKANIELKAFTKDKETFTKPLNAVLTSIRKRYKPVENKLEAGIKTLRKAIGAYQTEKEEKAEEERIKIASRVGSGKGKLKIGTAARQMAEVDGPEKKVETESGSVSFKDGYEITVVDIYKIPEQFLSVDTVAIEKAFKAGGTVEGVTAKKIKIPINRRA